MSEEEFDAFAKDALIAAYHGFLHLRLLKYLDDVFRDLPANLASEKIDPLKQRQMVEAGFRGNLVVRLILDAARDLLGTSAAEAFVPELAAVRDAHTHRLFEVANQALEITALNRTFTGNCERCWQPMDSTQRLSTMTRSKHSKRPIRLWEDLASPV